MEAASSGLVGKNLFSVVSISLTWAVSPPWPLLLASTFHDHFCPGLNAGYILAEYIAANLPLGPGEQYVTVTAPGKCPADALQVLFNTTGGERGGVTSWPQETTYSLSTRRGQSSPLLWR